MAQASAQADMVVKGTATETTTTHGMERRLSDMKIPFLNTAAPSHLAPSHP